jgi:CMP-N,N'-diacetyllegionaminic acid synthase
MRERADDDVMRSNGLRAAVICARGGSKGVPDKNLWSFRGNPLVAHAVATALETGLFDTVIASSDSEQILAVASRAGADIVVKRPKKLADDHASKVDAIRHAVERAESERGALFEVIVDLDVTTPLRLPSDVVDVVTSLESTDAGRVLSASVARRSPYFNQVLRDRQGVPRLVAGDGVLTRRQDSPEVLDLSGAVYAWRRRSLFSEGPLVSQDARIHVLPAERAWDIDTELDLVVISAIDARIINQT